MGISSYGFSPVVVAPEDGRGVHGNNERVSAEALINGTQTMIELVQAFTGT
jgi:hypothetical protein